MPAKTPIYLKSANGSKGGVGKNSKKLRELLSTDMISPPLGDFRHMAHVGRGGADDMFGDTSFLKEEENGNTKKGIGSKKKRSVSTTHETATLDRKPRKRNGMDAKSYGKSLGRSGLESPILKNAVSLPSLNKKNSTSSTPPQSPKEEETKKEPQNNNTIGNGKNNDCVTAVSPKELYTTHTTPNSSINGNTEGPPKPRRIMAQDGKCEATSNLNKDDNFCPLRRSSEVLTGKTLSEADIDSSSTWSLNIDLGPSLLDEVMGVMDRVSV